MSSKTKDAIVAAFLTLIEREEFDKITVTDLVEMCDISRQTFYYHFDDIDQMLCYAFELETKKIYSAHETENWTVYAEEYVKFFEKYDTLMCKSLSSTSFVLVYNLITKSFSDCLFTYFCDKRGEQFATAKSTEFLIELLSGAFSSMIINTIQKEKRDYAEIFNRLSTALNGYIKND
ncbi:MAG: TetR family transcriptional regulator [Eubacterium sp.]|nr:TetR family transcriptional regulator [Eubacterium sp.]MBR0412441.1 TetR family transcriptional regulator [Eubacterium sp.]